ncbi:MAG: four helix bundle protein [Bacteroidota bacterium]
MATVHRFEELRIWQEARQLVREIYSMTGTKPFEKDYGLKNQIQRAAVSVMSNISEGFERGSNKEFVQYLFQSKSSCGEVRSQLYIALDLGYIANDNFEVLFNQSLQLSKEIATFISYLKRSPIKGHKYNNLKLET